jgi:hypothetical protein
LLHVDIHGRTDTYTKNSDIELGVKPMKLSTYPEHKKILDPLVTTFEEKMNKVFSGVELNGFPVKCTSNCKL